MFDEFKRSKIEVIQFFNTIQKKEFVSQFLICNIFLVVYSLLSVLYPYLLSRVIDQGIVNVNYYKLCIDVGVIVAVSCIMAITFYIKNVKFTRLGQEFVVYIKGKIFKQFRNYDENFFEKYSNGQILAIIENDIDTVKNIITANLSSLIVNLISVIGMIFILYWLNRKIFLGTLFLLLIYSIYQFKNGKKIKKEALLVSEKRGDLYNYTEELVNDYMDARSMNAIGYLLKKYQRSNEQYYLDELKFTKLQQKAIVSGLIIQSIGIAGVLFYGGGRVVLDKMTIGTLFSLVVYCQKIYAPILSISGNYAQLKNLLVSIHRINLLLNEKTIDCKVENEKELVKCSSIILNNVSFGRGDHRLVENFNVRIEANDKIGIIGENGAGKTTLVKMLFREKNDYEGNILLNKMNLSDLNSEIISKNIMYLPQSSLIFEDTIRNNILLGNEIKINKTIEEIVQLVGLEEDINRLDNGLDTKLGTNGVVLSGGQKRKISLARVFVQFPAVLILDEPTADLDYKSEEYICDNIYQIFSDRIVIVITHRKKVLEKCNRILEIKNKRISILKNCEINNKM